MKIVILDGHTLNPGDLSWDPLRKLGDCAIFDRTNPDEVVSRAVGAEIILTNKTMVTRGAIANLPDLRCMGILATGYNVVDIDAARERGIPVMNVPTYGTASVAQMVFAHLLNLVQGVGYYAQTVREGRWSGSQDFCYWDAPLRELRGLTLGIIGLGRIGLATARIAEAFGMAVIAYDRSDVEPIPGLGVQMVPLDELFRRSDVVSLHCPLTPETRHLVNRDRLSLMKRSAYLINTSRGPLVNEDALAQALNDGVIAGAGLDVLSVEPPSGDNPLLSARNCFITPHSAWATTAARERLLAITVENVASFVAGRPQNVVNGVTAKR